MGEVAAPELVDGELAWDGRQPRQRFDVAVAGFQAAGEDRGRVVGVVEADEDLLLAQLRSRVGAVERDALQVPAWRGPGRSVADAGHRGVRPLVDLCEACGSEDGFGSDSERVEVSGAGLGQQRARVALLAAGGGGRDGRLVTFDDPHE